MKPIFAFVVSLLAAGHSALSQGRAPIPVRSADPYLGTIVVDARTGQVLFEERADEPGYPASIVKLMNLVLVEDRLSSGFLTLSNRVQVTAEASQIGGSQVYLAEKEVFTVEELLAAMVIHSANDAAAALAIHVAGSRPAFVEMMNRRALMFGMRATRFESVHGLPPSEGQQPDVSTARDLAILGRELLARYPHVTRYTSVQNRPFRNGAFNLRNPDKLIGTVPGCDGLKTGYIRAGGFSIVSTAERNGRRVIAVVLGSKDSKVRDAAARDLLARGLLAAEAIPLPPPPPPVVTNAPPAPEPPPPPKPARNWKTLAIGFGAGLVVVAAAVAIMKRRRAGA